MDRTALIATLNAEIDAKLAALHLATPRVSTRRIDRGDYTNLLTRAFDLVQDDDQILTFSEVGGFVPNSYGHRAETDMVTVVVSLAAGTARVSAVRTTAQSRPRGQGNCWMVRLQKEGQAKGRVTSW